MYCAAARAQNGDFVDLHRIIRAVLFGTATLIAWHPCNFFYNLHAGGIALAENGVSAVQVWRGNLCNKELRAICVGPRIGVRQPSRTIKDQVWRSLVLERVARSPSPRPEGLPPWIMNWGITRWKIVPS